MRTKRSFMIVLLLCFSLCSCATMGPQSVDTPEKVYLAARTEFNSLLSRYIRYKEEANIETQALWTAKIDPVFYDAAVILDAWGLYVTINGFEDLIEENQQKFMDIKNELIDLLLEFEVFKDKT